MPDPGGGNIPAPEEANLAGVRSTPGRPAGVHHLPNRTDTPFPADTHPDAAFAHLAVLRRLGLEGRARMTFQLSNGLRRITEDGVRHRHPGYTDRQVRLAAIRLILGDDLFAAAFPGTEERTVNGQGQDRFLRRLVDLLESAGIPCMLSGSLASSFHGSPRATVDIDLVIDPTADQLERFLSSVPAEQYYVSAEAARDALRRRTMFNVIDSDTGWKADLIVRKDRPFSLHEFQRRSGGRVLDTAVPIVSPEDVILSKLEWGQQGGGSERQYRDALGVAQARRDELDWGYLRRWAEELGVVEGVEQLSRDCQGPTG